MNEASLLLDRSGFVGTKKETTAQNREHEVVQTLTVENQSLGSFSKTFTG
jgi:hypothetical protein